MLGNVVSLFLSGVSFTVEGPAIPLCLSRLISITHTFPVRLHDGSLFAPMCFAQTTQFKLTVHEQLSDIDFAAGINSSFVPHTGADQLVETAGL